MLELEKRIAALKSKMAPTPAKHSVESFSAEAESEDDDDDDLLDKPAKGHATSRNMVDKSERRNKSTSHSHARSRREEDEDEESNDDDGFMFVAPPLTLQRHLLSDNGFTIVMTISRVEIGNRRCGSYSAVVGCQRVFFLSLTINCVA
jgi:hypothetical protein